MNPLVESSFLSIFMITLSVGLASCANPNLIVENNQDMLKLEEYLKKSTHSDDISENLKIAQDLLESKSNPSIFSSLVRDEKNFVRILRKFVDLDKTYRARDRCNLQSYKTLKEINSLAGGEVCTRRSQVPNGRVEFIIYSCATRHAYDCRDIYVRRYQRVRDEIDSEKLNSAISLASSLLTGRFQVKAHELRFDLAKDGVKDALGDAKSAKIVLELLMKINRPLFAKIAKQKPHEIYYDLEELFSSTFGAACDYFTKQTANIFRPSGLDEQVLPIQVLVPVGEQEEDFSLAALTYELCNALPRDNLVHNMVSALNTASSP